MQALRTFARSAPRGFARLPLPGARSTNSSLLLRATCRQPVALRASVSFHTSRVLSTQSDANLELVERLSSELQLEKKTRDSEVYADSIKEFLENTPFELVDNVGEEEVTLKRKFNDETIEVTFSIADLANIDENPDELDDPALYDEENLDTAPSGGANTKGAINQGRTSDGNIAVAPEDSLEDEGYSANDTGFPARVNVKITREGRPGALVIGATADSGDMIIENIWHFNKAEQANAKTAELEWQQRNLYTGPPFENLDEEVKLSFEHYLEERGINTGMALFIPDYIDHKEQKEYVRWLSGVKGFIE